MAYYQVITVFPINFWKTSHLLHIKVYYYILLVLVLETSLIVDVTISTGYNNLHDIIIAFITGPMIVKI